MNHANEVNRGASSEALATAVQVAKRLGVSERWVRDHATRRSPRLPVVKLGIPAPLPPGRRGRPSSTGSAATTAAHSRDSVGDRVPHTRVPGAPTDAPCHGSFWPVQIDGPSRFTRSRAALRGNTLRRLRAHLVLQPSLPRSLQHAARIPTRQCLPAGKNAARRGYGRYRVWQRDPDTDTFVAKQRTKRIGPKSELTKFQAEERLRDMIAADNSSSPSLPADIAPSNSLSRGSSRTAICR